MKHLPDTELAVMKAIWACGEDVSRAEMEPHLAEYRWTANAINTYLSRLAEKGLSGEAGLISAWISAFSRFADTSPVSRNGDRICTWSMPALSTFCR